MPHIPPRAGSAGPPAWPYPVPLGPTETSPRGCGRAGASRGWSLRLAGWGCAVRPRLQCLAWGIRAASGRPAGLGRRTVPKRALSPDGRGQPVGYGLLRIRPCPQPGSSRARDEGRAFLVRAQPVGPWRADRPWPFGGANDAPIGRGSRGARVAEHRISPGSRGVSALEALGGSQVVLRGNAAWALAAALGFAGLCSLLGLILAWRAARRARAAVRLLQDIRRSDRRPPPTVVPGRWE